MRLICITCLLLASLVLPARSIAGTELQEREDVMTSAGDAFLHGDFARLEEMSHSYRDKKERTPSGLWKLTFFYIGISNAIGARVESAEREAAFSDLYSMTEEWVRQYPDSPSAHITQSTLQLKHAWSYRGESYASDVKPQAWAPFRKYASMARQNLEAHKAVAAVDPNWYGTMLDVARAQAWEREEFDQLLDEALGREPTYYQNYFAALEYLLPKWHGSKREIEEFAQTAAMKTAKQEGHGMYARIYWSASEMQFKSALFSESLAQWPDMKRGFEDIVARYPDAWNYNNYAKFACLAHDKEKTRELMRRIRSDIVVPAWEQQFLLRWCTDWAAVQ